MVDDLSSWLPGLLLFFSFLAAALSLPVSRILLWLYRRAVLAAMQRRTTHTGLVEATHRVATATDAPQGQLAIDVMEQYPDCELPSTVRAIFRRALWKPWETSIVYAVGGLGFAIMWTGLFFFMSGAEPSWMLLAVLGWTFAWPIALTTNIVMDATRRAQAWIVLLYLASLPVFVLGLWLALSVVRSPSGNQALSLLDVRQNIESALKLWALTLGLPTGFVLTVFLHRKLRAVGPLVFVGMFVGVAGTFLGLYLLSFGLDFIHDLYNPLFQLLLYFDNIISLAIVVGLALLSSSLLGWWTLSLIRRRYERKQISDQTLLIDAVWLVFTLSLSVFSALFEGVHLAALGLSSILVYKLLTRLGFSMAGHLDGHKPNHRLLFLRVFGSQDRSERLMSLVGTRWRYVGSMQLIAGTDLATANVEPHEFLEFVRGRLASQFIQSRDDLERHIIEMDLRPDHDGRFRINEFFCYDDTWRMTLSRLAAINDAVLMDLRGFRATNQGVIFELNELVNVVPLSKVVLVTDGSTDMSCLHDVLDRAWASMATTSPNRGLSLGRIVLCELSREHLSEAKLVLASLARAVASTTRTGIDETTPGERIGRRYGLAVETPSGASAIPLETSE